MSRYLVAGLGDADMIWLLSRGKLRALRAGDRLVESGRAPDDLYFILGGSLEVVRGDGIVVATLGEGEVVGEMSFVESYPPSVSVRARDRAEVLATPRAAILERFDAEPAFAVRFYRAIASFLSDRLRETTSAVGLPASREPGAEDSATIGARLRRLLGARHGRSA